MSLEGSCTNLLRPWISTEQLVSKHSRILCGFWDLMWLVEDNRGWGFLNRRKGLGGKLHRKVRETIQSFSSASKMHFRLKTYIEFTFVWVVSLPGSKQRSPARAVFFWTGWWQSTIQFLLDFKIPEIKKLTGTSTGCQHPSPPLMGLCWIMELKHVWGRVS